MHYRENGLHYLAKRCAVYYLAIECTHRGVRNHKMQAVSGQQILVFIDEIKSELEPGERVGANVLTAERLDEREVERDARVLAIQRRVRVFEVVAGGARGPSSVRDECKEKTGSEQRALHFQCAAE